MANLDYADPGPQIRYVYFMKMFLGALEKRRYTRHHFPRLGGGCGDFKTISQYTLNGMRRSCTKKRRKNAACPR